MRQSCRSMTEDRGDCAPSTASCDTEPISLEFKYNDLAPESECAAEAAMACLTLTEDDIPARLMSQIDTFCKLDETLKVKFVQMLISRMAQPQISEIQNFIEPILKRDFIANLPQRLQQCILGFLDSRSLLYCERVSPAYADAISVNQLWKRYLMNKFRVNSTWQGLAERRGWSHFFKKLNNDCEVAIANNLSLNLSAMTSAERRNMVHRFYKGLYPTIRREINQLEENWRSGTYTTYRIRCQSENSRGVYCLQYDNDKIVCGLRDNTIKIWDCNNLSLTKTLKGHTGSVLCLQYDNQVIVSGSSDGSVRVWDVKTGSFLHSVVHHTDAVLHLRFGNGTMVTCSKDRSVAVWNMTSPCDITIRRVLVAHRAAVNAVDFDDEFIVSGSGDRTIKVWKVDSCEYVRTLNGHRRGIACLQYRDGIVVSGSSDFSIKIWDISTATCLRNLEGHGELVRCIRFDSKRIISGAYDGKIKIWDMKAALDPRVPASAVCLATLEQHDGRVFRLQFDEFQIVSSSHDDSIIIWDFLHMPARAEDTAKKISGFPIPPPTIVRIPPQSHEVVVDPQELEDALEEVEQNAFADDL